MGVWYKYVGIMCKKNRINVTNTARKAPVFMDILVLPDNYTAIFHVHHLTIKLLMTIINKLSFCSYWDDELICLSSLDYPFVLHIHQNTFTEDVNLYVVLKVWSILDLNYTNLIFNINSHCFWTLAVKFKLASLNQQ